MVSAGDSMQQMSEHLELLSVPSVTCLHWLPELWKCLVQMASLLNKDKQMLNGQLASASLAAAMCALFVCYSSVLHSLLQRGSASQPAPYLMYSSHCQSQVPR